MFKNFLKILAFIVTGVFSQSVFSNPNEGGGLESELLSADQQPTPHHVLEDYKPSNLEKHINRTKKHIQKLEQFMFQINERGERIDIDNKVEELEKTIKQANKNIKQANKQIEQANKNINHVDDTIKQTALREKRVAVAMRIFSEEIRQSALREKVKIEDARMLRVKLPDIRRFPNIGARMMHTIIGFPMEAVVFYAAIGASMWSKQVVPGMSLNPGVTEGREDPTWFDNWVYEFTSPVGVVSFLCFVLVSGLTQHGYTNLINSRMMNKVTKMIGGVSPYNPKRELSLTRRLTRTKAGFWRYKLPRWAIGGVGSFGGQLGMAMGMTASNIVHEVHTFATTNPAKKQCFDDMLSAVNPEESNKACDMAFEEMASNVRAWAPMIISMLSASIFAHQFAKATVTNKHFIRKTKKVFTSLVRRTPNFLQFVWAPLAGLGKIIPRFGHLFFFMEFDQRFTSPSFEYFWTEGMKAKEVVNGLGDLNYAIVDTVGALSQGLKARGGMGNFIKHHDVNYETDYHKCEDEDQIKCEYHPSILSMHKTASYFDRWRTHQTQWAMMAQSNWLTYVSKALGTFDLTKSFYKLLFSSKNSELSMPFLSEPTYFGKVTKEETAIEAIKNMHTLITESLSDQEPFIFNKSVISLSPSHFIKKDKEIRSNYADETHLKTLRALFSVAKLDISLDSYEERYAWDQQLKLLYGDEWQKALEKETNKVRKTKEQELLNTKEVLKTNTIDDIIAHPFELKKLITEAKQKAKEEEQSTGYQTKPFDVKYFDESGQFVAKSIKNCAVVLCDFLEKLQEGSFLLNLTMMGIQNNILTEDTLSQENELSSEMQNIQKEIQGYAEVTNNLAKFIHVFYEDNSELTAEILDDLFSKGMDFANDFEIAMSDINKQKIETHLKKQTERILKEKEQQLLSEESIGTIARNYLRNRALSAGLEYLYRVVKQKKQHNRFKQTLANRTSLQPKKEEYKERVKKLLDLKLKGEIGNKELTEEQIENIALLSLRVKQEDKERIDYIVSQANKQQKLMEAGQELDTKIKEGDDSETTLRAKRENTELQKRRASLMVTRTEELMKKAVWANEVAGVFHTLGADSIWPQLYEWAFELKPLGEGMALIEAGNEMATGYADGASWEQHPKRVNYLKTPKMMDYLVVSAVCGPDLTKQERVASPSLASVGALGIAEHAKKVEQALKNTRKEDILRSDNKSIMEKTEEIFEEDFPVFERFTDGQAWAFFPPRITTMDKEDRENICQNFRQTVDNIYDSHFKVGDKEYTSLLEVVKDHVGMKDHVLSAEEFDKWWELNMAPYQEVYKKTADLEYQYIVQDRFIKAFFQNDTNKEAILTSAFLSEEASWTVWDNISHFSKKWVSYEGKEAEHVLPPRAGITDNHLLTNDLVREYTVELPKGLFQNIYFEAHYWADIILYFAKKRKQYWLEQSWDDSLEDLINQNRLKEGLDKLLSLFSLENKAPACLGSESDLGQAGLFKKGAGLLKKGLVFVGISEEEGEKRERASYLKACKDFSQSYVSTALNWWKPHLSEEEAKALDNKKEELCNSPNELTEDLNSLSPVERFWHTLCYEVAEQGLYINIDQLLHQSSASSDNNNLYSVEGDNLENLAGFTKNANKTLGSIKQTLIAPLPDQIINYALLRLYTLREQAHNHVLLVEKYISEHPDFLAQQIPLPNEQYLKE